MQSFLSKYSKDITKIFGLASVVSIFFFVSFVFYLEIQNIKAAMDNTITVFPRQTKNNSPKPLKILFFGDTMLDRSVETKIKQVGLNYIFDSLAQNNFFEGYDIIGSNLEGAVTNDATHYEPVYSNDFAFSPELIFKLKKYNFNFFNLANNHFFDQGEIGIKETRKNLDELGFYYVGCRNGVTDDCSEKTIEIKEKKISMFGFSLVGTKFDAAKAIELIKKTAEYKKNKLIIVNMHWGEEYAHEQNNTQAQIARGLIDAGADIIIGHHPHVIQGVEIYKKRPIFYSLGNFIFDQYFSEETQESYGIGIEYEDKNLKIIIYPIKSISSRPELMIDEEKLKLLEKIIKWSDIETEYIEQIKEGQITIAL